MKFFLSLLCGMLITSNASAVSGKEYLGLCSLDVLKSLDKPTYEARLAFCTGYIRGVLDGHYATSGFHQKSPFFCIPEGKTYLELTGEVVGRLGVEQQHLEKPASGLSLVYFARAFPCEKKP